MLHTCGGIRLPGNTSGWSTFLNRCSTNIEVLWPIYFIAYERSPFNVRWRRSNATRVKQWIKIYVYSQIPAWISTAPFASTLKIYEHFFDNQRVSLYHQVKNHQTKAREKSRVKNFRMPSLSNQGRPRKPKRAWVGGSI